jgi:hypothetical protein
MNFIKMLLLVSLGLVFLSCGERVKTTLPWEKVLNICLDEKNGAISPKAVMNLSNSKKGNRVGFSLSFSSDFIKGTDPDTVYDDCIKRLSN